MAPEKKNFVLMIRDFYIDFINLMNSVVVVSKKQSSDSPQIHRNRKVLVLYIHCVRYERVVIIEIHVKIDICRSK